MLYCPDCTVRGYCVILQSEMLNGSLVQVAALKCVEVSVAAEG